MDKSKARSILGVYREGKSDADPQLRAARREAELDPELAHWWKAERELDDVIGAKLRSTHVPAGLKERFTAERTLMSPKQRSLRRPLLALAAAIVALAVVFGSWRGPFQPATVLADYRGQMIGFLHGTPTLELEASDLHQIEDWLAKTSAPSRFAIPAKLQSMEPVGCRTLRYRKHDVALICFKRGDGLVHLFVIDKAALPKLPDRASPRFTAEGEWMTAAWQENGEAYLLMLQGERSELANDINNS